MMLDGHIHIRDNTDTPDVFASKMTNAGIDGGLVISRPPPAFSFVARTSDPATRLKELMSWCSISDNLYPFYWIDPIDDGASEEVDMACDGGILGFKVICDRYSPGDDRAMATFARIADAGRPILFHSGILWDGKPSSIYNRPSAFESLLEIPRLRFSMAHISWPWCDECIAVYGKFLNAHDPESAESVEMFIDTTPGTPPIYRKDALTKLLTVGYDIEGNILFGSDCDVGDYNAVWTREWIERDRAIYNELGISTEVIAGFEGENLRRFVGISESRAKRRSLNPGQ